MLSYIEIGATISTLFITDRNDFEFAFEKLRKCRQTGSVILPTPNTVGYQELFLCGAKTAGREAGHVCRSTAKLKMPVFVPTYVVTAWCLKHSDILP